MATAAQLLYDDAECLSCLGGVSAVQTLRLALLGRTYAAIGGSMTPQQLADLGSCYACLPGVSQADAIELVLLDLIGQNIVIGSGGTSLQLLHGSGPPSAPPSTPSLDAIYLDNDENSVSYGTKWSWDVDNAVWI